MSLTANRERILASFELDLSNSELEAVSGQRASDAEAADGEHVVEPFAQGAAGRTAR